MTPLFAVEDSLTAIIALIAGLGGGGVAWLATWLANNRKTTITEYQEIVDRLQKRTDRQQGQIDSQQAVIGRLISLWCESRAEAQDLYNNVYLLHSIVRRAVANKSPINEGDIPTMPEKPQRTHDAEVEFLRRSTEHNSNILKESANSNEANEEGGTKEKGGQ